MFMVDDAAGPYYLFQFGHFGTQHLHCKTIQTRELMCLHRTLRSDAYLLPGSQMGNRVNQASVFYHTSRLFPLDEEKRVI